MAFEENVTFTRRTIVAAADLSAKQFFAVYNNNVANAAKNMDGILQDNPTSGHAGCIATGGISKAAISASQALTAGVTLLEVDTAGTFKALASGVAVAKAMETITSTAAVKVIAVEILKSNGLFV
jgi:hypothetical protein